MNATTRTMALDEALAVLDALPAEPPGGEGWHAVAECAAKLASLAAGSPARWGMNEGQYEKIQTDLRARIAGTLALVPEGQREALAMALRVAGDEIARLEQVDSDLLNELAEAVTAGKRSTAPGWFRNQVEDRQRDVAALRAHVEALRARTATPVA